MICSLFCLISSTAREFLNVILEIIETGILISVLSSDVLMIKLSFEKNNFPESSTTYCY